MEKLLSDELSPPHLEQRETISLVSIRMEPLTPHGTQIQITKSEQSSSNLTEKSLSEDNSRPSDESVAIVSRVLMRMVLLMLPSIQTPTISSIHSHSSQITKSLLVEPLPILQQRHEIVWLDSMPMEPLTPLSIQIPIIPSGT